ncbi:hypothetical protein GDO78_016230 [Eleutherodactylus coqui]|uniref:Secreted protein n=1 Tax=Eleutherodactylus coqui TaxID=57060 RepID=A0A8J6BK64_ELECQ|nr:hypothetical protein GDO78_016230 [Eleutherodactylus coqui]
MGCNITFIRCHYKHLVLFLLCTKEFCGMVAPIRKWTIHIKTTAENASKSTPSMRFCCRLHLFENGVDSDICCDFGQFVCCAQPAPFFWCM